MNEANTGNKKRVILVVDDNEEILEFICDDLSEKYEVITSLNGHDALKLLQEEVIHLVISDVMMPVMDGFELCKTIKSDFEYSHVPVILLTAKNTLQSKIEGLELGADAYIEKPFSPEHLQVQIANLLSNRDKIKKYFAELSPVQIESTPYSKADEDFLEKINDHILQNLSYPEFDVEKLADILFVSRPTLYRKIKVLTDLTPFELINITRLKKAAELLATGRYKIYEVAELTGFSSPTHLGRNFQKQFGMTPKEYTDSLKQNEVSNRGKA